MTDNVTLPGTGAVVATDDDGTAQHQYVKLEWGPDNTQTKVDTASGKPLPVQLRSPTGVDLTGSAGTASAAVVTVQGIASGTTLPVTASAGTNLNTSALALETGGNLATLAGAVSSSKVATKAAAADFADGAIATLGLKADAKSTATDTTAITLMQVAKQISASVQAPPSQAVTNAGTFAVQAAVTAASGSIASGAVASGAMVDLGAIADAAVTAGATGSLSAKLRSISRDLVANIVLAAGSAIIGKVGIDQTTPGTTNGVTPLASENHIGEVGGNIIPITNAITTSNATVTTGQCIGGLQTLANAVRVSGSLGAGGTSAILQSAILSFTDAITIPNSLDLYFFNASPSGSTTTNAAAFVLAAADRSKVVGIAHMTDFTASNTAVIGQVLNLAMPYGLASATSLFACVVARGSFAITGTTNASLLVNTLRN